MEGYLYLPWAETGPVCIFLDDEIDMFENWINQRSEVSSSIVLGRDSMLCGWRLKDATRDSANTDLGNASGACKLGKQVCALETTAL